MNGLSFAAVVRTATILAAILLVVRTAAASDFDTCANASGDTATTACTRAITSRQYSGRNLAVLYFNRGVLYRHNGDLDHAIAD